MTFLNPAVLIGLLAASIPVIIHLLNLRKLKKIEFSTLAFLKELQKNKIRKIKIKQWLLLALRVLIILFIVMAFARPALRGLSIAGTTSAAKTSAVFILDNSFSMSVLGQNGSYINQAKDIIRKILEQLKEGDEAAVILSSENNQNVNLTSDFNQLINQLNQSELSYIKGDLHKSLTLAAELVNKSKNFNREIYILSDFQKNIFPKDEIKTDLSQLLNENVKIYSFPLSEKKVFNLAIDDLRSANQIFEIDKPVTFNISIGNYSEQNVQNGVISVFVNQKRAAQKSFDVEAGKSVLIDVDAVPDKAGFIDISAEIESDDIEQDNKRFVSLFIPEKISCLIISDDNSSSKFLKLALQTIGQQKLKIDERNSNQIGGTQLKNYEIVFLCSDNLNLPDKFLQYLNEGGSLVIIPPVNVDINKMNNQLKALNLPNVNGFAGKQNDKSLSGQFDKIDFNHPVFLNLFKKEDKKNIESPQINYFLKLSTQGKGSSIITLTDGSAFLSEYKSGKGKIFLFNTAHDLSWSNFPLKTIYAPLLVKSLFYLVQKENQQDNLIAGNPLNFELNRINSTQIRMVKPDSSAEIINVDLGNQKIFDYKNTNLAGFYKIYSNNLLIDNIAVNYDKSESNPVYADENDFNKYLELLNFNGRLITINKDSNPSDAINQARFGSELWRIFLLIAILLAILEMNIARNVRKEIEGISKTN
ncbi:BatA and WFA domain-containing protein [Ignavibacterium sp.]|uniref:BatA and WFA domain-containing protein n=1 Tax=Ignavibacterium sp. TaxID=2651167 RepID=UPI00307F5E02